MQRLEVSGAVRPLYGSLGFKGLNTNTHSVRLFSERVVCSLQRLQPTQNKEIKEMNVHALNGKLTFDPSNQVAAFDIPAVRIGRILIFRHFQ